MCAGRASVQQKYLDFRVVADAFCPDLVFAAVDGNEADAAGFNTGFCALKVSVSGCVSRCFLTAGDDKKRRNEQEKQFFHGTVFECNGKTKVFQAHII